MGIVVETYHAIFSLPGLPAVKHQLDRSVVFKLPVKVLAVSSADNSHEPDG